MIKKEIEYELMKLEIKSLGTKSMLKTTLYIASIPIGVMFIFGIIALLIGAALGNSKTMMAFIPFLLMPFFMIIVYGILGMLVSVVYNFFANKFGGLELTVHSKAIEEPTENN